MKIIYVILFLLLHIIYMPITFLIMIIGYPIDVISKYDVSENKLLKIIIFPLDFLDNKVRHG